MADILQKQRIPCDHARTARQEERSRHAPRIAHGLRNETLTEADLPRHRLGRALLLWPRWSLPPHYGRQIEFVIGLDYESVTHKHHPIIEGAA